MHKVADEVSRMRKSKEKRDVADYEAPCFVTKGRLNGKSAQPEHDGAVIAFQGSAEAETWTGYTASNNVPDVGKEP